VSGIINSMETLEGEVSRAPPFPTEALPDFDPFLLLDEMDRRIWPRRSQRSARSPHRGFETVTYMLEGRMQHKDHTDTPENLRLVMFNG